MAFVNLVTFMLCHFKNSLVRINLALPKLMMVSFEGKKKQHTGVSFNLAMYMTTYH